MTKRKEGKKSTSEIVGGMLLRELAINYMKGHEREDIYANVAAVYDFSPQYLMNKHPLSEVRGYIRIYFKTLISQLN